MFDAPACDVVGFSCFRPVSKALGLESLKSSHRSGAGGTATATIRSREASKIDVDAFADICLQNVPHLQQRILELFGAVCGDTIGRHEQFATSHIGVVGGKQNADIADDAGQNQSIHLEMLKKKFEGCCIKAPPRRVRIFLLTVAPGPRHQPNLTAV
jgi:hypothetical protein